VGLTGGILTLPFMVSFLGFTQPSVSSTNLIFVLLSPMGSIYSYWRERRMLWRLGLAAGAGGVVGALLGPRIRAGALSDASVFRFFFGLLLLFAGARLIKSEQRPVKVGSVESSGSSALSQGFTFSSTTYTYPLAPVVLAGALAGAVSTAFGVGTGFLLVPVYTTLLGLPIHAVTGSALLSTLLISLTGTVSYSLLEHQAAAPDIRLGLLLGIGGVIGGFLSPKLQRRAQPKALHLLLGSILLLWGLAYTGQGF